MFTAYELMRRRFGERIRKLTASIFLVTRALAEGVRVFAISLVISIVLGTGEIAVDRPDRRAHAVLHLRRRHDRRHLDRRRADDASTWPAPSSASSSSSARFPAAGLTWRRWPAPPTNSRSSTFTSRLTMAFFSRTYTFWAGLAGRLLPDHRQPRHRSAHGAAPAERPRRAPEPHRAARPAGS